MATVEEYPGIRFPDRAEALSEFSGYKIFLEPWEPLAVDLRTFYEGLALRRESRALAIHSPQGTGKTLFAQKLQEDFVRSRDGSLDPDPHNLWHRITGGAELTPELIQRATALSDILLLENNTDWVNETANWLAARSDRRCVVIADNAERPYFRQGLVSMTDTEYVGLANDPQLTALAAQRFVEYCRSTLRGALFILLSNDDVFLLALDEAVEAQHQAHAVLGREERVEVQHAELEGQHESVEPGVLLVLHRQSRAEREESGSADPRRGKQLPGLVYRSRHGGAKPDRASCAQERHHPRGPLST